MITFYTNLDKAADWAAQLGASWRSGRVPCVGDSVSFTFLREGRPLAFELRVASVTWDMWGNARVELHVPTGWSIDEWVKYYERHVEGRSP